MTEKRPRIKLKKWVFYNDRLTDLLQQRAKILRENAAITRGFMDQWRALRDERDRLAAAESEKQAEKGAQ